MAGYETPEEPIGSSSWPPIVKKHNEAEH